MFNLDPGKLLVIAVVAIILLGPDRLPQVARQVGGAWRSFNEFRHRMETEVRSTMPDLPPTSEIARLARSPSALLNHLSNMSPEESPSGGEQAPDGSFAPPAAAGNGAVPHADGAVPLADGAVPHADGAVPLADGAVPQAPPPDPAPPAAEPPDRAPRPPGLVVPGDPTLN
jgi:sec-independent protein translocase protein TatB